MRRVWVDSPKIVPSEITPREKYLSRRALLAGGAGFVAAPLLSGVTRSAWAQTSPGSPLSYTHNPQYSVPDAPNSFQDISTFNNFYEFGTGKADPAKNAQKFKTEPWTVAVSGECEAPGRLTLEDVLKPHPLEERIYRMRCVEGWSMVIPWVGLKLGDLIRRFKPTSRAKYVEFTTLMDRNQMPGERRAVLDWPYTEGLRMDEAMNPLAFMAVGLYGKALPNQNGAPLRLVIPWKYGFKGIKSIVSMRFVEHQPDTTWAISARNEYGFYANVNPAVDHPRWSQATERHIGGSLFDQRRPTLPFNGYASQVAGLYTGMNLKIHF